MDRRIILIFLFIIGVFSLSGLKCLWVTRWDIQSVDNIDNIIKFADKNSIDILFVQIFGNGKAFFNTNNYPKGVEGFDPLEYIVDKAQSKGIEVHAWINVGYVWSYEKMPSSPIHIINRYSDYRVQKNGFYPSYRDMRKSNSEGIYVALANRTIKQYYKNLVKELLNKYDIDGIQLDYIRYPGKTYIYGVAERTEFYREHYVDLEDEEDSIIVGSYQWNLLKDTYPDFIRWRVSVFVKELGEITRGRGKTFTAAVIADYNRAKNDLMQDWVLWTNNDYIDYAVTMSYTSNNKVFKRLINNYMDLLNGNKDKLIVGLGAYNQSYISLRSKMRYLYEKEINNISFFSYSGIINKDKKYLQKTEYLWAF